MYKQSSPKILVESSITVTQASRLEIRPEVNGRSRKSEQGAV